MNKREVNEIKALYDTIEDCGISRLAGCYVNNEREKISTFNDTFLNLPKEEMYKYLEIFRKSLSGTQGKNLLDMEFVNIVPEDTEGMASAGDISGRNLLLRLRKSELKDDALLDQFYDRIIDSYDFLGSYLILVIYQAYDVPGKTTDNIEMDDASEEVYKYIMCSICPIKVTKPGLGYDESSNEFHALRQDKYVELPETAILYPAFNDRSTDENSMLYYTKQLDQAQSRLLNGFLQVAAPTPGAKQKEVFRSIVSEVLADESDVDTVSNIQRNLVDLVSQKKSEEVSAGPVVLKKEEVARVLEKSGVTPEKVENFEKRFEKEFQNAGDNDAVYAANIVPARGKLEMKTPDVVVKINYERTSLVETRVIDGKKCLVIELGEGLEVNGIPVRASGVQE